MERLRSRETKGFTDSFFVNQLESIGGALHLYRNPSLSNLSGLEKLTTIEKYLWISENENLSDIKSLSSLKTIGNYVSINAE